MDSKIKLCEMDKFILKIFPDSKVYEDGVYCDFDLLKQKTIEMVKFLLDEGRDIEIDVHFNMDNLEVYISGKNKSMGVILDYESLINEEIKV